ncbi:MAG: hypothetical protein QNJ49_05680 [Mastigocoleus sp. MO_167.B18]|uniref:hypothetical protein n=1 Tax=Mastigocoleus sp. MO_188.B34 TaxID=3036635 RepID=UPI0026209C15|nr:hypothetical protein [Mastigocoleus sp. MO_188.B34]MDJ0697610.1 hypothetical protein [Mastigocoleus sp. MO_188.B34]MDJ0772908.1 hypothetical protein [Mastigocoleus sp. MO_167.B18]
MAEAGQINAEELAGVIKELETYRERLVNDTLAAAQKAKMSKSHTMAQLEPQLAEIDAKLQEWRELHTSLTSSK